MPKQERHLTTELLSAFLDNQLSSEEQFECDAHLKTCEPCQHVLAELRQTVRLLHAMPVPALPRSFALPIAEKDTEAVVAVRRGSVGINGISGGEQSRIIPLQPAARQRPRQSVVYNTVRALSTLAAVLAIAFLLSGVYMTGVFHAGGIATTASSGASSAGGTMSQHTSSPVRVAQTPGAINSNVATPSIHAATPVASSKSSSIPHLPLSNIATSAGLMQLGLILLLLSLIGFLVLWRLRRQRVI